MKIKLRIISLLMLIAAVIFVLVAVYSMDSTVTLPFTVRQLHIFYYSYLCLMVLIFAASFFVKDNR